MENLKHFVLIARATSCFCRSFDTSEVKIELKQQDWYPENTLAHAIYSEKMHWKEMVHVFFYIFAQNIDCGYTLQPPRRGCCNAYPQSMFWNKNKKNRCTPANSRTITCYPDEQQDLKRDFGMQSIHFIPV